MTYWTMFYQTKLPAAPTRCPELDYLTPNTPKCFHLSFRYNVSNIVSPSLPRPLCPAFLGELWRTILGSGQLMGHSVHLEDATPVEDGLFSKVDIDVSPASKRVRLAASLPHRSSLSGSRDPLPAPLPTTSASLPRHLKAFARIAPRPRARIIVADVHRMGRIAVHADVFAQIIEAEERVMGPGAARTRRACRRERPRSISGSTSYRSSTDSSMTHTSNDSISTLSSVLTSDLEDGSGVAGPWPDAQYPWSFTALQVEDQRVRARHAELAHVEQWLAAADDEHDNDEEPAWNNSASTLEGELPGLGELPEFPTGPIINSSLSDSVASDEDGADARTALLARASVQDFIARRTARAVVQHTPSGDVTAPESVFQPTFVPNSTPSRRIVVPPPISTRAPQWQPSLLLPPAAMPETPERTAHFPFIRSLPHDSLRISLDSPKRTQALEEDEFMHVEPSPSTPPIRSDGTTTPMTPERSTEPRPQPHHSGSTIADSAGPASPAIVGSGLYAGAGACSGPGVFSEDVGVYAGEDSLFDNDVYTEHGNWGMGQI
ncbi:hypothetical protein RhiXN_00689 [Rhizoctonia solani]|uniref:Uncharacterized protein n=1 Tax=Rhizoctonia solani TaxID=456999 RepID=A0A8H8NVU4_9AGAM|nr:uncharacterized protein RhiXN_00689 [Rhizoctonia solani]QRW19283.1 hypothetical protein RhiXN_00689 [Rhizoctonia solani]